MKKKFLSCLIVGLISLSFSTSPLAATNIDLTKIDQVPEQSDTLDESNLIDAVKNSRGASNGTVVGSNVNFRQSPNGAVLGSLANGTKVWDYNIIETAGGYAWAYCRIESGAHAGKYGWIAIKYLN